MKFSELVADYLREHNYDSHIMPWQWEEIELLWVGLPEPTLWFAYANEMLHDETLYYIWYKPKCRQGRLKTIESDIGPFGSKYKWEPIGTIHDPELFNKIIEVIQNPPMVIPPTNLVLPPPRLD